MVKRPARLSLGVLHYLYNVQDSAAMCQPVLVLGELSAVGAQVTKQEYDAVRSFLANNVAEQVNREPDLQCFVPPPDSALVAPAHSLLAAASASARRTRSGATGGPPRESDWSPGVALPTATPAAPGAPRPNTRRLLELAFTLRDVEVELAGLARLELVRTRLTVRIWDGDLKVFNLSLAEARVLDLAPGGARGLHPLALLQRMPRLPLAVLDADAGAPCAACVQ